MRTCVKLRDRYAARIREKFPDIPRRVSGYNLPYLLPEKGFHVARALVGSENTCVTVLEATVQLIPNPAARSLLVVGFEDIYTAADAVPEVLEHRPIGLEGIDERMVRDMRAVGLYPGGEELFPKGNGWLLIEFGGDSKEESGEKARLLAARLGGIAVDSRLYDDPKLAEQVWKVRESGLGATAHVPGKPLTWEGWEDSAVAPEKLGGYLRDLRGLMVRHRYEGDFYGHFGQGCVHVRINFDLESKEGVRRFRAFLDEAADLVVSYGGSLSGEHGDGQARAELLPKMFGPELIEAFREFKRIWDPDGKMNPGKVVDAHPITENLRLGTGWNPPSPLTAFAVSRRRGEFPPRRAALRRRGQVPAARRGHDVPELHGHARGEALHARPRAAPLRDAARRDNPRRLEERGGPRRARPLPLLQGVQGGLPRRRGHGDVQGGVPLSLLEGQAPPPLGLRLRPHPLVGARGICRAGPRQLLHADAGALRPRSIRRGNRAGEKIPRFAARTFRAWFESRVPSPGSRSPVLLFPDTFNNFFNPGTARAAVEVLEAAGFRVTIPRSVLCCGRPLYDYGMLDLARRTLRRVLRGLRDEIENGVPVIVLEPSCAAVFRDELTGLFPDDEHARRLSEQTYVLSEFLRTRAPGFRPPPLARRAILQGHCHQRAIMKMTDEEELLRQMGIDVAVPEAGCCGMAGAFGFERGEHYDVSTLCGEKALLPEIRRAPPETLVIADGFSCREQIRQGTAREALHLAQVLQMAMRENPGRRVLSPATSPRGLRANGRVGLKKGSSARARGLRPAPPVGPSLRCQPDCEPRSRRRFPQEVFLRMRAAGFRPPPLARRAILQGHCHQRAIMKMTDEEEFLRVDGNRRRGPRSGMLRHGRGFRIRARRALRRLDPVRGESAPAGNPAGPARDSRHRRRLLLPRADPPSHRARVPSSGRRSCSWPWAIRRVILSEAKDLLSGRSLDASERDPSVASLLGMTGGRNG